jgi:hypothetical protein
MVSAPAGRAEVVHVAVLFTPVLTATRFAAEQSTVLPYVNATVPVGAA